jgi:hypothetical protein
VDWILSSDAEWAKRALAPASLCRIGRKRELLTVVGWRRSPPASRIYRLDMLRAAPWREVRSPLATL